MRGSGPWSQPAGFRSRLGRRRAGGCWAGTSLLCASVSTESGERPEGRQRAVSAQQTLALGTGRAHGHLCVSKARSLSITPPGAWARPKTRAPLPTGAITT